MTTFPSRPSITLSRRVIACAAGLGATGWLLACSDPTAPPVVAVSKVAASEGQSAMTGNALPLPLRVRVEAAGSPKEGVTVRWEASAGTVAPDSSVTDFRGEASSTWILGPVAGPMTVSTTVPGATGSPLTFHATALAHPTRAGIVPASNRQTGVVGTTLPRPLQLLVDSNGAPKPGVTIHWRTGSGSVSPETSVTDADGHRLDHLDAGHRQRHQER